MKGSIPLVIGAAVTIVVFLFLQSLFVSDPSMRNYEYFPDMGYSQARKPMSTSSVLPMGITQQMPVDGVVIRNTSPFPFEVGKEEATRAGEELKNPISIDDEGVRERGAWAYSVFCVHCHAPDGSGTGTAVQRGMAQPPSLHGARAKAIKDGEIFHIITLGQGNMPSHAAQVTPADRWKVALYIRTLQAESE